MPKPLALATCRAYASVSFSFGGAHTHQLADGVEVTPVIMRDQQHRRGSQPHHRVLELLEGAVAVQFGGHPALPAVVGTETNVERVVVADAARQHSLNGHGFLET